MTTIRETTTLRVEQHLDLGRLAVTLHVTIDPVALRMHQTQMGTRIQLEGWPRTGALGGPGLPARTFWVALPDRTEARGVLTADVLRQSELPSLQKTIAPMRPPRHDWPDHTRAPLTTVAVLPAHYESEGLQPRPLARLAGVERIGNATMALIEICPFVARNGSYALATQIEVRLPLAIASDMPATATSKGLLPTSASQFDRLHALASAVVVNPDHLVLPLRPVPRDIPLHWDYIIVTDDTTWNATTKAPGTALSPSLVSAFQALADWKSSLGLRARVVRVAEIVASRNGSGLGADFITGAADLQTAIRAFLRWAHNTWGTAYVLLGGDTNVVPMRHLAIGSGGFESMPTDLYYAALNPANDTWIEGLKFDYSSYGFDRLMPSISLGRAPASNAAEASNFVAKVKRYESLRYTDNGLAQPWLERILYVSTKWGGDTPSRIAPATAFPPPDDLYAQDPGQPRAVIKLADIQHIHADSNPINSSPNEGCFGLPVGKPYVKLCQKVTYKNPNQIVANTVGGAIVLTHMPAASPSVPGWFYTDWLDNDGPCHDASGQNYPTAWIVAYLPAGRVPTSLDIQLSPALRLDYNLLADLGAGDYRSIPYDPHAPTTGHGWCFAVSAASPSPSPIDANGRQVPTPWLTVHSNAQEIRPLAFVLDPTEEADTMGEQETLRKQVRARMPGWDSESALYPDVVDIPAADRGGIDLEYYTQTRLRAALGTGQHIVSIGGHGNVGVTCGGGEGGQFDNGLADGLANAPACGILFANSCLTNRYAEDSLSRHLVMKNSNGGMVGYVGYGDVISIGLGHAVEAKFFADLASTAVLGLATDARASMVVPGSGFDVGSADLRYTIFMMALLGDPALRVHGAGREYLVATSATAVLDAAGRINVLYLRPDHKIAQIRQDPGGWDRAAVIERGSWASQLAAVANADGRIEAIYIGSDNKLYHLWQTTPGGTWSPSFVLDKGSYAKQVIAVPNADRRIEVIYIGSDNKLYHIWQLQPNGGWTASFVLDNGSFAKQAAAVTNQDGRIEVVYIGSDNKLYHLWQTAPNSGWTGSGVLDSGSYAKQVIAVSNVDRRIEVIYTGSDDRLYHLWQTAPNGGWSPSTLLAG